MKQKKLSWVLMMLLFSSALLSSGCRSTSTGNRQSATSFYYTCPMHHQVHEDKPGYCPICGMKLIKVLLPSGDKGMPLDSALSYLTEPVTQTVVGSFTVTEPVKSDPNDTLMADGYIGFDERSVNEVNTRVTGRIEKLYVLYAHQYVQKGQPLMTLYSPQWVSAEKDLLQAIDNKDHELSRALSRRLLNLGMPASEIRQVIRQGAPLTDITIYSPYEGITRQTPADHRMETAQSTTAGDMNSPELLNIREGMYIKKGQTVFTIQGISHSWAILNVFTQNVWQIHVGDSVTLFADASPGYPVRGQVDFIPPYRPQDEKTTRIRVYPDRLPAEWKIGTLIHGQIIIHGQGEGWYVPLSAVNRLGLHHDVIWVQDKVHPDVFHARDIKAGIQTSDSLQIIAGIRPGDKIVEDAAYMVGSDSFTGK